MQLLLQFQILISVDSKVSNPAVAILKISIKVENAGWNPRWLPTTEMVLYDFQVLFSAYNPVFDYFYVCKCYVPGVTRKELGNQNLVFEKSAKSTFKI